MVPKMTQMDQMDQKCGTIFGSQNWNHNGSKKWPKNGENKLEIGGKHWPAEWEKPEKLEPKMFTVLGAQKWFQKLSKK